MRCRSLAASLLVVVSLASCRSATHAPAGREVTLDNGVVITWPEETDRFVRSIGEMLAFLNVYHVRHGRWPAGVDELAPAAREAGMPLDLSPFSRIALEEKGGGHLVVVLEATPPMGGTVTLDLPSDVKPAAPVAASTQGYCR